MISTAGHVDHGKSTLVTALTGVDPDRLEEEKERGLTIDLGFGAATLPSGRSIAIVDVPGHVRFLKNMLAGVGAVDACLFVVAATEGWKPQTEEHLRILELLGVAHGVVALTKVGQADDDLRELALLDIAEHTEGTFLEAAPVVPVDAVDGIGLEDLRRAIDEMIEATPRAADTNRPRLWVDRSFSIRGAGTVVTGTLTGGRVRVDDELRVCPADHTVRIRAIQSHAADRTKIGPGNRVALNLGGIDHDDVGRGDVLVRTGQWHHTDRVDAALSVLASLDHPVSRRGAHLAYIGSGEHPVRLRVLGPDTIAPGQSGSVRLFLPTALPLQPGDRFVLREAGRGETVGGGEILDVDPVLPAARARPDRSIDRVVAERGWVHIDDLERLTGERRPADLGDWVVDPGVLATLVGDLRDRIESASGLGVELAELDERERAALELIDGIEVEGGHIRIGEAADPLDDHPFLAALEADPFSPPDPDRVDRAELRELVRRGSVTAKDGVYFATSAVDAAAERMAELLAEHPDGVTVAQFRDRLGCTRKHAVPLLTLLDETGRTRRRGDVRIAGPRLPAAG